MNRIDAADFSRLQTTQNEKTRRVKNIFSSVAPQYDLMNDLMSMGIHRLWKRYAVHLAKIKSDSQILDLAAGTGDMAILMKNRLSGRGNITLCDINEDMLSRGRERLINRGILKEVHFIQGNAENLPFPENSFDLITIAFGLRNVADKNRALLSMYETLRFGGQLLILEFSKVALPVFSRLYDEYSYRVIPWLGKRISGDEASYRYLVESIRVHPDQPSLVDMMRSARFDMVDYINLSAGMVAIHRGYKL